jgi:hypothetical protein
MIDPFLMNIFLNVQVCDATDDDSCSTVGNTIKTFFYDEIKKNKRMMESKSLHRGGGQGA